MPGPITLNDLWNIIPVDPPISMVKLTGDEIRTVLEENLEHTFSQDPYCQMGGYVKRVLGMDLYIKVENAAGQRIQELFVQRQPLKADQHYTVAFVTAQGVPDQYGVNRKNLELHAIEGLRKYLAAKSPVDVSQRGTVIVI